MCTLSWLADGMRTVVLFNRDEKRNRGHEVAPSVIAAPVTGGLPFIAPRDSDHGGTWIAANAAGLGLALLNGYRPLDAAEGEYESRGRIVLELARDPDAVTALDRLRSLGLERFRSFVLALFDPGRDPVVADWDGRELRLRADASARSAPGAPDIAMPILSSSFRATEVAEHRRAAFAASPRPYTESVLEAVHRGHFGGKGPYSVCMHREDAETRSFTRLRLERNRVALEWSAGSPCLGAPPVIVSLGRASDDRAS